MYHRDWLETGEEILCYVLDAVENADYSGLSKNIRDKVSDVINANLNPTTDQKTSNATQDWVKDRQEKERVQGKQGYTNRMYSSQGTGSTAGRIRYSDKGKESQNAAGTVSAMGRQMPAKQMQYPELYKQNPPGTWSGPICKVLGIMGTALFGAGTFVLTLLAMLLGFGGIWLADFVVTTCLGGSIAALVYGTKTENFVKRFKTYVKQIGDRQYCELEKLASVVGKKKSFVEKEIRSMLYKGFFLQGHLDDAGSTLITSDAMYQNYLDAEKARKTRELREAEEIKIREISGEYPKQVRQILEEGERYIRHVQEANDAIPGEVMSEKLYRLEDIMRRIFEQLKVNPSSANDLQKLMKYYLPTTTKLLDAYCNMDGQPSYGENNIANTRKEIEDTMDIIIDAFGKIFDDMFEDAAWDISTEISTMKTMLAKEGLTGERDFFVNKEQ